MKLNLRFVVFLTACCAFGNVYGQNVSVDPLTGKPSMAIPIWTVNSGNLATSIGVSYYGTPKVNDGEGPAGMGWNLNAGGSVVREVRGLPDDYVGAASGVSGDTRNGWLYGSISSTVCSFNPTADQNLSVCTDESSDWSVMNSFAFTSDTEPDVFRYHAPGLAGSFIFNRYHVKVTIPYSDVKIDTYRGSDSLINKIVITNNAGVVYTFVGGDKVTRTTSAKTSAVPAYFARTYWQYNNVYPNASPATFYTSWYLKSVSSPAGGHLTFTYGNAFVAMGSTPVQVINPTYGTLDTLYVINDKVAGSKLLTVNGSNEQATLTWNAGLLASVSVKDLTYQTLIKQFKLDYHFVLGSSLSKRKPKRAYLTKVMQEVNCAAFPGYQFTYHGVNLSADTTALPYDSGIRQDLFGYYNGTATSAAPEVYIASGDTGVDGERYRISSTSGYSLLSSTVGGRTVDGSKVYYGSLATVTLPSGGLNTITYEAADYYDTVAGANIAGGGPRVKSVKTTGSDVASDVTMSYRYLSSSTSTTRSSGRWTYKPMFVMLAPGVSATRVPYNLAPEEQLLYYRVEESVTGRGKTVYDFRNLDMYPSSSNSDFTATLTRIARPDPGGGSCRYLGDARGGTYTAPYAPNTNYDFERARAQTVSQYNRQGKLLQRTSTAYQRTTLSTDVTYGISFEYNNNSYQYQKYPILANVDNVTATETSRIYEIGTDSVSANYVETITTYAYSAAQMLRRIKVTTSGTSTDTTSQRQTFKYAKDYATTGTDTQGSMIAQLVTGNRHGTAIEAVSYKGTTVTGANLTLFNNNFGGSIVRPWQQLAFVDTTGFTQSTVSGSAFQYASSKYVPVVTFDAYDSVGHVTISHNLSKSSSSVMMGYRAATPALEIQNGRSDQLVYSDFEPYLATSLTSSIAPSYTEYWSGQYSASITSSSNLSQSGIVRAAGNYRFGSWVKASGAVTFTISINGSAADTVKYPTASAGKWKYVEKTLSLSGVTVGASFSFQLTAGASANLDNLAFYPASATIAAHVYDPLNGKTADLDARGNAIFTDYDGQGRLYRTRNVDKDIVQITDYHYKAGANPLPISHFTASSNNPDAGTSVTYTADASCMGGVTYAWYVDDVQQASTTAVMSYVFPGNVTKDYHVKLVATSVYGSTATDCTVHPNPVLTITVTKGSGESSNFDCHEPFERHLTVNHTGCYDAANTTYEWYYTYGSSPGAGLHHPLGTTTTPSLTVIPVGGANNYVYCVVHTTCTDKTTGSPLPYVETVITNYIAFFWQTGTGC